MPYPNHHTMRIKDPEQFDTFRTEEKEGKLFVYGIKNKNAELQSIRFEKDKYSFDDAKSWMKENNYKPIEQEKAVEKKDSKSKTRTQKIILK
jgi:hypothetical protein